MRGAVAGQEGLARGLLPGDGRRGQPLGFLGALRHAAQRRPARVVERAQHAGHVAQRRALGAPLVEAARGLALEVDDDEVVVLHQHLAQVEVAVVAALDAAAFDRAARLDAGLQRGSAASSSVRASACAAPGSRSSVRAAARAWPWRRWPLRLEARVVGGGSGSGSKAAAPVRVASALCSSAVRRPSVAMSARKPPCTRPPRARRARCRRWWPRRAGSAPGNPACSPSRRPGWPCSSAPSPASWCGRRWSCTPARRAPARSSGSAPPR
jgi:hypothetical protein